MQAEIIAIGDELLIGQVIDTNSAFIASQLNSIGIAVKQKRVVADAAEDIVQALDTVLPDTKLVFMTGGLGPTKDDVTKVTLTEYFGGELRFEPEVLKNIEQLFAKRGREVTETNRQQAFLPSNCSLISNAVGTAAGMRFERNGRYYFSLPGVPYETEHLVGDRILPWIEQTLETGTVVHKTFSTQGVPESELARMLEDWENQLPVDISLAYLPSPGEVRLRLSTYGGDKQTAAAKIGVETEKLREILKDIIFGEDGQLLEEVVGQALRRRNFSVSTAESCTGGYIAHLITRIAGSSDYFKGSLVSYATKAKADLLHVDPRAIEEYGVVSKQVVEQMALGAQKQFGSDFSVATTGVLGPGGGTEEVPVGTVEIAVAGPQGICSRRCRLGEDRERNIRMAALTALNMLRRELQNLET